MGDGVTVTRRFKGAEGDVWLEMPDPDPNEERETYARRYHECKRLREQDERNLCLYDLLHDITMLQDRVNLTIRPETKVGKDALELADAANAILLEVSSHHGGPYLPESGYLEEKADKVGRMYSRIRQERRRKG